jgi:subtilisin family serine protease
MGLLVALTGAACHAVPAPPPPPPPPSLACALATAGSTTASVTDGQGVPIVAVTEAADGTIDVVTHEAVTPAAADAFVDQLEATSDVLAVQPDGLVHAVGTGTDLRPQQWALDRVPFEAAWDNPTGGARGDGVVVAVVDSGIDGAHPDLAGQFVPGVDWVVDGKPACTDAFGHGTHVAGIIAAIDDSTGVVGAAPDVELMPVRVLNNVGSGTVSDVASGIEWAIANGADVINLSLGSLNAMPAVQTMIQYANANGVVVVASAGNCNPCSADPDGAPDANVYPGAYPEVISVGALAEADPPEVPPLPLVRAAFSRATDEVDVSAPGMAILSTYPGTGNLYKEMSGTSMAAPFVSAAAALFLAKCPALQREDGGVTQWPRRVDNGAVSVASVTTKLTEAVVDLGPPGRDNAFGFGVIDPNLLLTDSICS